MSDLHVQEWGEGIRAVLVHGSISTGEENWAAQRPLADQGFRLIVPDRRGYGPEAKDVGEDYETDAEDVDALIGDGAHLVGHSYGAIAVLLAAAQRPDAVLSLTVVEPPAWQLALDNPAVTDVLEKAKQVFMRTELSDREFLEAFLGLVGGAPVDQIPEEMLQQWTELVGPLRRGRMPSEAKIPMDRLRSASFPKLVITGGHSPAFDAVCNELAEGIGAERAAITGAGHAVQMLGRPFNETLLRLWRSV